MKAAMLALAAACVNAFEVELTTGGSEPIFFLDESAPSSFFSQDVDDLMEMVSRMGSPMPTARKPTNPCEQDQQLTGCGDAACLKSHFESLSPTCAMFLLQGIQASPSPAPKSSGFFSYSYTDSAGKVHTDSGRLSSAQGRKIEGEMESMMDEIFPGFGALFGLSEPPPRAAPPPRPQDKSQHACAAELTECSELLGGVTATAPLQQCLVQNYNALNPDCKCFLHQLMGEELEKQVPSLQKAEVPRVRTVAVIEGTVEMDAPRHGPVCALFMFLVILTTVLVIRRIIWSCCAPRPKNIAFVPPEQTVVKMTVEPLVAAPK